LPRELLCWNPSLKNVTRSVFVVPSPRYLGQIPRVGYEGSGQVSRSPEKTNPGQFTRVQCWGGKDMEGCQCLGGLAAGQGNECSESKSQQACLCTGPWEEEQVRCFFTGGFEVPVKVLPVFGLTQVLSPLSELCTNNRTEHRLGSEGDFCSCPRTEVGDGPEKSTSPPVGGHGAIGRGERSEGMGSLRKVSNSYIFSGNGWRFSRNSDTPLFAPFLVLFRCHCHGNCQLPWCPRWVGGL
jgi:hypothetical protein